MDELITGGTFLEGDPLGTSVEHYSESRTASRRGGAASGGENHPRGGYLPLSSAKGLPIKCDTRYRAAVGFSEKSDALVAVVPGESGEVSMACPGSLIGLENPAALSEQIEHPGKTPKGYRFV